MHGLTAATLMIQGEDAGEFEALRADLFDEYRPQGALEECLVEQMASLIWRLRRVPVIEAAVIDWLDYVSKFRPAPRAWINTKDENGRQTKYVGPIPDYHKLDEPGKERFRLGRKVEAALKWDVTGKLGRYEKHLFNQFTRICDKFSALQAERNMKQNQPTLSEQSACVAELGHKTVDLTEKTSAREEPLLMAQTLGIDASKMEPEPLGEGTDSTREEHAATAISPEKA